MKRFGLILFFLASPLLHSAPVPIDIHYQAGGVGFTQLSGELQLVACERQWVLPWVVAGGGLGGCIGWLLHLPLEKALICGSLIGRGLEYVVPYEKRFIVSIQDGPLRGGYLLPGAAVYEEHKGLGRALEKLAKDKGLRVRETGDRIPFPRLELHVGFETLPIIQNVLRFHGVDTDTIGQIPAVRVLNARVYGVSERTQMPRWYDLRDLY